MATRTSRFAIIFANALIPVALLVFCSGYFPYKPILPGLANYEANDGRPLAVFDRVILMVVDALRRSERDIGSPRQLSADGGSACLAILSIRITPDFNLLSS